MALHSAFEVVFTKSRLPGTMVNLRRKIPNTGRRGTSIQNSDIRCMDARSFLQLQHATDQKADNGQNLHNSTKNQDLTKQHVSAVRRTFLLHSLVSLHVPASL